MTPDVESKLRRLGTDPVAGFRAKLAGYARCIPGGLAADQVEYIECEWKAILEHRKHGPEARAVVEEYSALPPAAPEPPAEVVDNAHTQPSEPDPPETTAEPVENIDTPEPAPEVDQQEEAQGPEPAAEPEPDPKADRRPRRKRIERTKPRRGPAPEVYKGPKQDGFLKVDRRVLYLKATPERIIQIARLMDTCAYHEDGANITVAGHKVHLNQGQAFTRSARSARCWASRRRACGTF
jgi:hypothetical protein